MILEHKRIDLFGKMLFEKMIVTPPFKKQTPMPDEACFLYILDGNSGTTSAQEQYRIAPEESVLMKCGNYVFQMFPTAHSNRYEALAVHFFPDVLLKVYQNSPPSFLTQKQPDRPSEMMVKLNSDSIIKKYIEGILFYFENPQLVNEEILILKLKEIILLLNQTQNASKIRAILSNLFNPTTYTFREIIEAHCYSSITVTDLASLANMSISTFKREFYKVYHSAPATYLLQKKLTKAAELLKISDHRLSDIAFDTGFSSLSHFSKAFKKQFGCTPSEYKLNQL